MDTNLERELKKEREVRRYAEYELAELREQQEREREAAERERQRRRMEREEEWAQRECQADTWLEALSKNERKFRREYDTDLAEAKRYGIEPDPTRYFGDAADACARAMQLWSEVASPLQAQIDALQAQIDAIVGSIAPGVADRLEAESNGSSGWNQVVASLRTSTPQDFVNW